MSSDVGRDLFLWSWRIRGVGVCRLVLDRFGPLGRVSASRMSISAFDRCLLRGGEGRGRCDPRSAVSATLVLGRGRDQPKMVESVVGVEVSVGADSVELVVVVAFVDAGAPERLGDRAAAGGWPKPWPLLQMWHHDYMRDR